MKKRLLSAIVSLCLLLTMAPTVAFAAEESADAPVLVEQGDAPAAAAEEPAAAPAAEEPAAAPAADAPAAEAPAVENPAAAPAAEAPAEEPAEKETETPAPKQLPTEIALCSYESKNGEKRDSGVSLAAAVTALNENGGGTITVTSSGLPDEDERKSSQLEVEEDITIIPQEDKPVTVYADGVVFALRQGKKGKLTIGQQGMKAGLLTFDGSNEVRTFITTATPDEEYQGLRQVEINDGVVLQHFTHSVIGRSDFYFSGKYLDGCIDLTMHGGEICNNALKTITSGIDRIGSVAVRCSKFYMDGGSIHDNTADIGIIVVCKRESTPQDGPAIITGEAKIYDNSHDPDGVSPSSSIISSGYEVILSKNAEIYGCHDTVDLVHSSADITLEDQAKIYDCTSTGGELGYSAVTGYNITMADDASIYNCTSEAGGAVDAYYKFEMSGKASIRGYTTRRAIKNYPVAGIAVDAGMSPYFNDEENSFVMRDDAVISNCSGPGEAGGVYVKNGCALMSDRAKIENCSTPPLAEYENIYTLSTPLRTGGIYMLSGSLTMCGQSKIDHCSTYGMGGGVYMAYASGDATLKDQASITNCTAFVDTSLDDLIDVYKAGGLYAEKSNVTMEKGTKITGCTGVIGGIGAEAGLFDQETINIQIDGEISGNAGRVGGGICGLKGVELTLGDTAVVQNNTATVAGGGIALFSYFGKTMPASTLTLNGASIIKNTAPLGAGVFLPNKADIPETPVFRTSNAPEHATPSSATITDGTEIIENTAKNPEGGTATEFHGGGLFLGWNTKTNISGAVKIFDNVDANNLPNNMYLRKAPDFDVETPVPLPSEQEELDKLQKYLANALEASAKEKVEAEITGASPNDILALLKALGLASENETLETLTVDEIKSRFAKFECDFYMIPYYMIQTEDGVPGLVTQYKKNSDFTPTYDSFNAICAQLITEDTLNAWGRMTYVLLSNDNDNDRKELNQVAETLGLIQNGDTYEGTVTEFAKAFAQYSKTNRYLLQLMCDYFGMELAVDVSNETFGEWWGVKPATDVLSEPDARVSVSGPLAGGQIGVITEGAKYGRVVAERINNYTLTEEDLAIFSSDDPFYDVVRHPYKSHQFILKPRETANNGNGGSGSHSTRKYTLTYVSNGGTSYKNETYSDGTNVTLNKTPSRESYIFTGWYADKELTNKITNIKMTGNKTVYAGWKATSVPDMLNGEDHFAYIVGYPDKTVRPQNGITRAEVATIFFRLLTDEVRDANSTQTNTYSDVSRGNWYNHAVSTLSKMGIVKGDSHGKFNPNAPITRAEFAAIAARFDKNANTSTASFSDIANHWAKDEISASANNGWINGYTDGTFRPNAPITRAEAMALINRVLQRLPESKDDLLDGMIQWSDNADTSKWYYLAVQEATNSHYDDIKSNRHEKWTKLRETRDWTELEK